MKAFRRFFVVLLGVLGVVCLVVCVVGVVGVLVLQKPLLERTSRTFEGAGRVLKSAITGVDVVHESLQKAQKDLESFKEAARKVGNEGQKPGVLDRAIAHELESRIQNAGATANVVTEASVVMNSMLSGLNQLPQTSVATLDSERLKDLQSSLADLTRSSQQLTTLLEKEEARGAAEEASRMDELLIRIIDWVAELQTRMVKIQSEVSELSSRTPGWIQRGTIVITLVLLWIAFSQLCLIHFVWSWWGRTTRAPGTI